MTQNLRPIQAKDRWVIDADTKKITGVQLNDISAQSDFGNVIATTNPVTGGISLVVGQDTFGVGVQAIGIEVQNYLNLAGAIAKVQAGTADCTIDFIGDSTTADAGGTLRTASWAFRFAQFLQSSYGIPATTDAFAGASNKTTTGLLTTFDPRMTFGAGWSVNAQFSYGGNILYCTGATGDFTFQPAAAWDTVEIEYITNGAFGTATVKSGVTLIGTIDARTPGFTLEKVTYTKGAPDSSALVIARTGTGGDIYILSARTSNSTSRAILVCNAGSHSSTSTDWSSNGTLSYYGTVSRITKRAAKLLVIALGVNDWNTAITPELHTTNLTTIINAQIAAGGAVLLVGQPQSDPGTYAAVSRQMEFITAQKTLRAQYVCGHLNMQGRWKSYADANTAGMMFDQRHPSLSGAYDWGKALAIAIAEM